ncbi:hypothetical protein QQ045_033035 [Rhodiola kirilowii]
MVGVRVTVKVYKISDSIRYRQHHKRQLCVMNYPTAEQKPRSTFSLYGCFVQGEGDGGKSGSATVCTKIARSKHKYRKLIRSIKERRRGCGGAAVFRYDPLSYAMNFEEEKAGRVDEVVIYQNLSFGMRVRTASFLDANCSTFMERS